MEASPEIISGCDFCEQLLSQNEGLVVETKNWRVLVSRDQGYLGRCLVIANRHIEDRSEMNEEEVLELHYMQIDLETAARRELGADICNWTQLGNDAYAEELPKPHHHYHMRPRYSEPVGFAGRQFDDPKFGQMYDLSQRWNVDADPEARGFKDQVANALSRHFQQ